MNYWCYIDESWRDAQDEKIGVLAATVGTDIDFKRLDNFMFQKRKKYLGSDNAKDKRSELKGSKLLGNPSFKLHDKLGYSQNLVLAQEVLEFVKKTSIQYIGITVYGSKKPSLLAPSAKDLARPFKELCLRIKASIPEKQKGVMVFDQRLGAQEDISIAISNYLSGMQGNSNLHPQPLIGVSNIHAGLQLADIAAFILGKWAEGDQRFLKYHRYLAASEHKSKTDRGHNLYGLMRLQHHGEENYTIRKKRFLK